jgi:hypothetical protein
MAAIRPSTRGRSTSRPGIGGGLSLPATSILGAPTGPIQIVGQSIAPSLPRDRIQIMASLVQTTLPVLPG